jgi:hypothetical protein
VRAHAGKVGFNAHQFAGVGVGQRMQQGCVDDACRWRQWLRRRGPWLRWQSGKIRETGTAFEKNGMAPFGKQKEI